VHAAVLAVQEEGIEAGQAFHEVNLARLTADALPPKHDGRATRETVVMADRFQRLSLLGAALTANALRPQRSRALMVPSFFSSWLAVELAPHNLAVTVAGTSAHLARHGFRRRDMPALALNAGSVAGLAAIIRTSQRARGVLEAALADGLGEGWLDRLEDKPDPGEMGTPWRQLVQPFRFQHPDVLKVADLVYDEGHGRRGRLDVYHRRDLPSGAPVLFQIHGGGWTIGDKREQGLPLMLHLAARGWVCVAPNYRLSPRAVWPDHIVDLKRALAWVRDNIAAYGGDPAFVAVTGGSAGGHLAAMVGLTGDDPRFQPGFEEADTSVQACVPFYGLYDIANELGAKETQWRSDSLMRKYVFKSPLERDRERWLSASPLANVRADLPPFFVIHGRNDTLAPLSEARAFVDRLRTTSKSKVVYAELPGTQHAFDLFPSIRSAHVVRAVDIFLRWARATAAQRPHAAADQPLASPEVEEAV
jgi:acetyl esterase/lipase